MSNLKIITGHYGSGKTEFCINYAINASKKNKTVIVDMDIVNPYFRSREKSELLSEYGIVVVGGSTGLGNLSADMPALPAEIYGYIDNRFDNVIFDVGGDGNGARVLSCYADKIADRDYDMYVVINANRPRTETRNQALRYIEEIAFQSRLKINGLINNTHMLRETSIEDIQKGERLCAEISEVTNIPVMFNVIPNYLTLDGIDSIIDKLFVVDLYMRPQWL